MEIPDTIICVDCGQKARRMTLPSEDGWENGDIVAYRCTGCNDRWDMVVDDGSGSQDEQVYTPERAAVIDFLEERRDGGA